MSEPSFSNGFASPWYGGRMKYPDLWRGCVGYWAPLLGPTGAALFDVSGFCNHGTLTNMTLATDWVVGRYGHSVNFDVVDNYIDVGSQPSLEFGTGDFSLTTWCFPFSVAYGPVDQGTIVSKNYTGFEHFFYEGKVNAYIGGTSNSVSGVATLTANAWYHLAIVRQGSSVTSYINGILDGTATNSANASNPGQSVQIGNRPSSSLHFHGLIAEQTLHNRALSPPEISLLAQRPGIMLERDDSDVWGAIEAGGSVLWWAFANRQSRIIGGGVT